MMVMMIVLNTEWVSELNCCMIKLRVSHSDTLYFSYLFTLMLFFLLFYKRRWPKKAERNEVWIVSECYCKGVRARLRIISQRGVLLGLSFLSNSCFNSIRCQCKINKRIYLNCTKPWPRLMYASNPAIILIL